MKGRDLQMQAPSAMRRRGRGGEKCSLSLPGMWGRAPPTRNRHGVSKASNEELKVVREKDKIVLKRLVEQMLALTSEDYLVCTNSEDFATEMEHTITENQKLLRKVIQNRRAERQALLNRDHQGQVSKSDSRQSTGNKRCYTRQRPETNSNYQDKSKLPQLRAGLATRGGGARSNQSGAASHNGRPTTTNLPKGHVIRLDTGSKKQKSDKSKHLPKVGAGHNKSKDQPIFSYGSDEGYDSDTKLSDDDVSQETINRAQTSHKRGDNDEMGRRTAGLGDEGAGRHRRIPDLEDDDDSEDDNIDDIEEDTDEEDVTKTRIQDTPQRQREEKQIELLADDEEGGINEDSSEDEDEDDREGINEDSSEDEDEYDIDSVPLAERKSSQAKKVNPEGKDEYEEDYDDESFAAESAGSPSALSPVSSKSKRPPSPEPPQSPTSPKSQVTSLPPISSPKSPISPAVGGKNSSPMNSSGDENIDDLFAEFDNLDFGGTKIE